MSMALGLAQYVILSVPFVLKWYEGCGHDVRLLAT